MTSLSPHPPASGDRRPLISVVVPACNEEDVLDAFMERLHRVMARDLPDHEVVLVNDGSSDGTLAVMHRLRRRYGNVAVLDLSRNFGKEPALTAGLDHARGEAVVVIDADLQDPPELIPRLVDEWRNGFDVVFAQRVTRAGESWLKTATARAFYRCMEAVGPVRLPRDAGDFRLLSRRAVDALALLRERHRFMKGLFAWIGFRQTAVPYAREPRAAGRTKWNYWRLWNFSLDGITAFTTAPLHVAMYVGLGTAFWAFVFGLWIAVKTVAFGEPVRGYPTIMVTMLFLAGVQLTSLGIIGQYLGRMFNEVKGRPLYLVQDFLPAGEAAAEDAAPPPLQRGEAR